MGMKSKRSLTVFTAAGISFVLAACGSTGPYIKALRGKDIAARRDAAMQLQKPGLQSRSALPELMRAAQDSDAELRLRLQPGLPVAALRDEHPGSHQPELHLHAHCSRQ